MNNKKSIGERANFNGIQYGIWGSVGTSVGFWITFEFIVNNHEAAEVASVTTLVFVLIFLLYSIAK